MQATIAAPTISDGVSIITVPAIQLFISKTNAMLQVLKGERLILSLTTGVMNVDRSASKPQIPSSESEDSSLKDDRLSSEGQGLSFKGNRSSSEG